MQRCEIEVFVWSDSVNYCNSLMSARVPAKLVPSLLYTCAEEPCRTMNRQRVAMNSVVERSVHRSR